MSAQLRVQAFEEFVAARWAALYRTAYLLTGQQAEAEDVLQATLVKAFASWGRIERADSAEAYVRRMLVNGFISSRRRGHHRHERGHDLTPDVPVATHESAVLDRLNLWSYVTGLPPRQRAVIVLRFYEDMSERQVAEVLGCSPGTVKSQTHDALKTLRACLGTAPESEGTRR